MSCYNSTVLDAPPDKVWPVISNFHDMSWAPDVITSVAAVGDKSAFEVGAKRILNDAFHETVQTIDEDKHTLSYSIDDGPDVVSKDAVSNYIGTIRLLPVTVGDNQTFIEWSSEYESADPKAVQDFCDPIYTALLNSLKGYFAG